MTPLNWLINDNYEVDHIGARSLLIDGDSIDTVSMQLIALGFPPMDPSASWSISADDCLMKTGAPPLPPAGYATHLGEQVYIYPFGYLAAMDLNGKFKLFHIG